MDVPPVLMQLARLRIERFRSLYEVDLALKPLTILIGPNAGGKSNLIKALRFLYDGIVGDIRDWQSYNAQLDDLLWYGEDPHWQRPERMAFRLLLRSVEGLGVEGRYATSFVAKDYLEVFEEWLELRPPRVETWQPAFRRVGDTINRGAGKDERTPEQPGTETARSRRTLTLREDGPSLPDLLSQSLYQHITGWRFFDADVAAARLGHFVPEFPDEVPSLGGDAANLSAFLYSLYRIQPDDFEAVINALTRAIDLPDKLLVEHDAERGGQQARYYFYETPFGEGRQVPPSSMSDGTIRLLSLLSLLIADRSASLACLEEPDHGLHPRLMLYLADFLREAASGEVPAKQIILTTHSAEFMDCFDLKEEADHLQVYVCERDETGRSTFTPTDAEALAPWLERYRLGEAVRRNFV